MPGDTQLILLFWSAILGGVLVGGLVGWRRGMTCGFAIGCLVIGLGSGTAAGLTAFERWQFISGSALVQGTLLTFDDGPQVEFRSADGLRHVVHGLGGSQEGRFPGDAVPLRVPAADPARAVVADFQNLWGGVLAFTLFGALPLAFGAFMLGIARGGSPMGEARTANAERRTADAPLSPMRDRLAGNLTVAGNLVMLGGFVLAFIGDDAFGLGRAFFVIGIGATLFATAFWMKRDGAWQAPAICLIVALGFVLFGGGAMLLGGR